MGGKAEAFPDFMVMGFLKGPLGTDPFLSSGTGDVVTGLVVGLHGSTKPLTVVRGGPKLELGFEQQLSVQHASRKCLSGDLTTKNELRKEQALPPRPKGRDFRA